MASNLRCVQCNKVSDPDIETNVLETVSGDFIIDTKRDYTVCAECQEVHEMLMSEYHIRDQIKFNKYYLLDE